MNTENPPKVALNHRNGSLIVLESGEPLIDRITRNPAVGVPQTTPLFLTVNIEGYLVMSALSPLEFVRPSRHDYFRDERWRGDPGASKWRSRLEEEFLYEDPDLFWPTDADLYDWLSEPVDYDELNSGDAMKLTQFGPALDLYEALGRRVAQDLGLLWHYGGFPGSDFVGIKLQCAAEFLNAELARRELNVRLDISGRA